ncbi:hypothetical protein [Streptomyces sp. 1222.5]|uniref:hypothetical protein n=1 Tax=Streptomyces sp. 1222.5 TaxID=1881026 RepID=UPI003EBF7C52
MSTLIQASQIRALSLGIKVPRATATIPQSTSTSIFTVSGGRVFITSVVGEVTTVIGATSVNFNLTYTPSGGSAADLCAATSCTSDAVGTLYSLTSGVATDLLSIQSVSAIGGTPVAASEVPNVTYAHGLWRPLLVRAGDLKFKTSASTTGAVKWDITYIPLDDAATVTAA